MRATLRKLAERGLRGWRGLGRASRFLLALNAFCWLLFLTREPVNAADYAGYRILPGGGMEFNGSTATPHVVASRTVAKGGWHGTDTAPVEAYRLLNRPGLIVGSLVYLPVMVLPMLFPWDVAWTIESWALACCLFVTTSFQWLLVGRVVGRLLAMVPVRSNETLVSRLVWIAFALVCVVAGAWWFPSERDDYLLQSSFRGNPEPVLEALKAEPENAELWRRLGRSYRMKDRWAEALPAYRRSVELDPTDFDAWADTRLSALCLKDEAEAERARKRLFALDAQWAAQRVAGPPNCCAFEVCSN